MKWHPIEPCPCAGQISLCCLLDCVVGCSSGVSWVCCLACADSVTRTFVAARALQTTSSFRVHQYFNKLCKMVFCNSSIWARNHFGLCRGVQRFAIASIYMKYGRQWVRVNRTHSFKHKLRVHSITLCDVTVQIVTHRVDWFSCLAFVLLQYCFNIRQHGRQILFWITCGRPQISLSKAACGRRLCTVGLFWILNLCLSSRISPKRGDIK